MDIKRLWRRKKSRGANDSQQAISGDEQRAHSRPSFSTTGDGRPSMTASRYLERPATEDRLGSSRAFTPIASDEYPRAKTSSRIQPILVGISRPGQYTRRPDTAGSLYNAVQQAADSFYERPSQDLLREQSVLTQSHERTGSNRSVDIFAIATSRPDRASRFNEEVALRNIDTLRAATAGNISQDYIPSSRYQEEVADRNTGLYSGRSSLDQTRSSLDYERTSSLSSRFTRNVTSPVAPGSPTTNGAYVHQSGKESGSYRSASEPTAYHSRQYSQRSRDNTMQLPSIPQGRVEEYQIKEGTMFRQNGAPSPSIQTRTSSDEAAQSPDVNRIQTRARDEEQYRTIHSAALPKTGANAAAPAHYGPGLGLQSSSRVPNRLIVPNSRSSQDTYDGRNSLEVSTRSNSTFSAPQVRRTSGNRTIMDLTSEDAYSEASSMYGYSQYSPVLEHANAGSFQRSTPVEAKSYGKLLAEASISNGIAKSPALVQPLQNQYLSEGYAASISDGGPSPNSATASPSQIAFSPINTLAAWSPRASMFYPPTGEEPQSMVQRAAAALEARSANTTPKPGLVASLEPVKRKVSPSIREFGDQIREESKSNTESMSVRSPTAKRTALETVLAQDFGKINAKVESKIRSFPDTQPSTPQSSSTTITPTQSPVKGFNSAEDMHFVNYADVDTTFGIRTRDFAISPRKSASSLKKAASQSLKRTAAENALKATNDIKKVEAVNADVKRAESKERMRKKTIKPRSKSAAAAGAVKVSDYSPEFDEKAFARKQAEAKAAFLKLQQSLKEDFDAIPIPSPAKTGKRASRNSDRDRSSAASGSTSGSVVKRPTTSESRPEVRIPPTSFRDPSGSAERTSSLSSNRSRGSRKAAPAPLKNVEPASSPISQSLLPPSLQAILLSSSKPPRSPGDISLSSFPLPSSRPTSEHESIASPSGSTRPAHVRRGSSRSQVSLASQFSIPVGMIPERSSSVRDTLTEEEDE